MLRLLNFEFSTNRLAYLFVVRTQFIIALSLDCVSCFAEALAVVGALENDVLDVRFTGSTETSSTQ